MTAKWCILILFGVCLLCGHTVLAFDRPRSVSISTKPTDPYLLEFHHTRYFGGCFDVMKHNYPYNTVVPWIQNFDVVVTGCGVNWDNPGFSNTQASCAFSFTGNRNTTAHRVPRIHVHSDNRHHQYFFDRVFPEYVERYKKTKEGIILHSGGGDSGSNPEHVKIILNSPVIQRWVIEQSRIEGLNHPKILFLPVGICVRENAGERGAQLREAISLDRDAELEDQRRLSLHDRSNTSAVARRHLRRNYAEPQLSVTESHRMLKEAMKSAKHWKDRKDKVFLCFNEGPYPGRKLFMEYAKSGNCSICEYCHDLMPANELWKLYGEYKYIVSPWGNGVDCGRSWEILLMGAIPVIEYFPGAIGYERGNLTAILVKQPTELTIENLTLWNQKYSRGTEQYKLTMEYWRDRVFSEDFSN